MTEKTPSTPIAISVQTKKRSAGCSSAGFFMFARGCWFLAFCLQRLELENVVMIKTQPPSLRNPVILSVAPKHYSPRIEVSQNQFHHRHSNQANVYSAGTASNLLSTNRRDHYNGDYQVENAFRDKSILDVIRLLSSQGESGRLQVTSGMTDGAVFVDRGQLIDAWFGKLTGFQAINALASIPDATFNFDPSVAPTTRSSITPNERILLRDFFGIGGVHEVQQDARYTPFEGTHDDDAPAQVVPLSDVDERKNLEMREFFVTKDSSLPLSSFTESSATTQHEAEAVVSDDDEVTVVRSKTPRAENRPAIAYGPISKLRFRPALFVTILTILMGAAAVALIYRLRERSSTTPATVQTSTPADAPQESNSTETTSVVSDLTGNWNVVNTVEQTSYQPYKNMEVGFELAINQTGNEFTGKGQKISENGQSLSGTSRTPILLQGSIDGDKVEATFSESGATRKTSGRFVWRIDRAKGGLTGTFASTAARSSGRSAATKRL